MSKRKPKTRGHHERNDLRRLSLGAKHDKRDFWAGMPQ